MLKSAHPLLRIHNLSVSFGGAKALNNISFSVEANTVVAVIGPNGAGKTSLLRAISGVIHFSGSICILGEEIQGESARQIVERGVIHCPQASQLFGEMTVIENLLLGAYARGSRAISRSLEQVFELFPKLKGQLKQKANTLSGGERQMVAIGRSLMAQPSLFLLDEPSLGLAPVIRDKIEESLHRIVKEFGLTVLLVEQDTAFALSIASKVCIMDGGAVIGVGSPADIASDPALQAAYLGLT